MMSLPLSRCSWCRRQIIGLLAAVLWLTFGLSGCSTLRLGYGQAATFSYWWLDGYLDFTEVQTQRVREQLAAFFAWHRATQLPDYASLAGRAREEVVQNVTPAQVCQWVGEATQRVDTGLRHGLPALTELARTLTPAQRAHLAKKFDQLNADFSDDFLQADRAKRLKASIQRAMERAEFLYGSLSRTQRDWVVKAITASPFDPEAWLGERQQRQQDILRALKAAPAQTPVEVSQALAGLIEAFQRSPRPAYAAYEQRLMAYNCALASQLHNTTTPEQRQHADERLKGWQEDLQALSPVARVGAANKP